MNCNLCGSNKASEVYYKRDTDKLLMNRYKLMKCEACDFTYVDPIPDRYDMEKLYNFDTYYGMSNNRKSYFHIIEDFLYGIRVNKIESIIKSGRALDIGCGSGKFLFFMKKRGWEVYGVESSKSGVAIGRETYNIDVFNGFLKEANYPEHFFDVITLWHVLEHIADPNPIFKEIKRIIKPDGVLFIAIPNIDSLEAKIFKENWFHLDIPRHLCHYSPVTLKRVASQNGFRILKINYFSLEHNLSGLLQSILNSIGCEFNFFYNKIKRGIDYKNSSGAKTPYYTLIMSWLLATTGLPLIFLLTELCSVLRLSGCMEAHLIAEEN